MTIGTFNAFNQNYTPFPTSNAIWNEYFTGDSYNYTNIISMTGDTVVSGTTYHNITRQQLPYEAQNIGGLRENSQKQVFFYSYPDSTEFLIYDFSKVAGDTIYFDNLMHYVFYYSRPNIVIENIDSAIVTFYDNLGNSGSEYRKRFITNKIYPNYYNPLIQYKEIWIEGIGSNKGLLSVLTPEPTCFCSWGLDNFVHNDTTYTIYAYEYNSIPNNILKSEFQIYPNPSNGLIWINYQKNEILYKFEVFNLTGEIIRSGKLINNNKAIDLSSLDKGIYFLKAYSQQSTFTEKVVIK